MQITHHVFYFRMWVLQSQGLDYRKRSSNSSQGSLEDFFPETEVALESKLSEDESSICPQPATEGEEGLKSKEGEGEKNHEPQPVAETEENLNSKEGKGTTNLEPQHVSEKEEHFKPKENPEPQPATEKEEDLNSREHKEDKNLSHQHAPEKELVPNSEKGKENRNLGPQHAELLVRLFKMCSEESTSAIILRLCNMREDQRLVIGKEVKGCPDQMVSRLVERLNRMEKEQMDFVLDTEGELASIVQEVGILQERETIELEAEIDQRMEAANVPNEERIVEIKSEKSDVEEFVHKICAEKKSIRIYKKSPEDEVVVKIPKKERINVKQEKIKEEKNLVEHPMEIDAVALEKMDKKKNVSKLIQRIEFNGFEELTDGIENMKKERVWAASPPCEVCGKVFNRLGSLKMHMVTHSNVRDFVCDKCPSKFSRKKDLSRHKKEIHDDPPSPMLECEPNCDFKSKKLFRLKNHQKNQHGIKLAFGCDTCDLTFYKNQHLKRHKFRRHTPKEEKIKQREREEGDKNKICDLCGKDCPSSRSLREHKNSHSPDYSCKQCGKAFTSTRNLNDHMNIVHEKILKYLCNLCGKSFGRSTNLSDHRIRKHSSTKT